LDVSAGGQPLGRGGINLNISGIAPTIEVPLTATETAGYNRATSYNEILANTYALQMAQGANVPRPSYIYQGPATEQQIARAQQQQDIYRAGKGATIQQLRTIWAQQGVSAERMQSNINIMQATGGLLLVEHRQKYNMQMRSLAFRAVMRQWV
jgi:hypothetical protein